MTIPLKVVNAWCYLQGYCLVFVELEVVFHCDWRMRGKILAARGVAVALHLPKACMLAKDFCCWVTSSSAVEAVPVHCCQQKVCIIIMQITKHIELVFLGDFEMYSFVLITKEKFLGNFIY